MVFGGAALDYGLGPLAVPKPHRLPVEAFPARLGAWQGGPIVPVDPDVQARIATSKIMERDYTDPVGSEADVMLVTATDSLDIHSPLDCFPSQGWRLSNERSAVVQGQPVKLMDVQQDEQKMTVMYWMTGYYQPDPSPYPLVRAVAALRARVIGRKEGDSLFVRLMVPATPAAQAALSRLAGQVVPSVQSLLRAGKRPGEQIASLPSERRANSQTPLTPKGI